jgi:hypothetical protein
MQIKPPIYWHSVDGGWQLWQAHRFGHAVRFQIAWMKEGPGFVFSRDL